MPAFILLSCLVCLLYYLCSIFRSLSLYDGLKRNRILPGLWNIYLLTCRLAPPHAVHTVPLNTKITAYRKNMIIVWNWNMQFIHAYAVAWIMEQMFRFFSLLWQGIYLPKRRKVGQFIRGQSMMQCTLSMQVFGWASQNEEEKKKKWPAP